MSESLLRKSDIAAMMGTSPRVAVSILKARGCNPVDLGCGRGRGLRWLESAVSAILRDIHNEAQAASRSSKPRKPSAPVFNLATASVSAVYGLLTNDKPLQ